MFAQAAEHSVVMTFALAEPGAMPIDRDQRDQH